MHPYAALILAGLGLVSQSLQAMPQTRHDRAYPQESYAVADYSAYNPHTLYDLLQRLPGVSLSRQPGGHDDIQLHGLDSRYLLLLINGQPVSGTGANRSLLTRQIPVSMVQRIDIDRNARADLHTGGGGSGTINVILNDAFSAPDVQISAGGPAFSHRLSASINAVDNHSEQAMRLSAERRLLRNEEQGSSRNDSGTGDFTGQESRHQTSLLLNYNGLLNAQHPMRLYLLQLDGADDQRRNGFYALHALSTEPLDGTELGQSQQQDYRSRRLGGDLQLRWDRWQLQLFFLHEQFQQQKELILNSPVSQEQQQELRDQRVQAGWQLTQIEQEHRWSTGLNLEFMKRRSDTSGDLSVLSMNNERQTLPQQFGYDELRLSYFLLDRWQVTPATRLEAGFHIDNHLLQHRNQTGSRSTATITDTRWLPSFHLFHQPNTQTHLRFSMSQSSRQPDIADRVPYEFRDDERIWRGNRALRAEVISSMDFEYAGYQTSRGQPRNDHSQRLRIFQRRISNALFVQATRSDDNGTEVTTYQPVNAAGSALLLGMEADLTRPLPWQGAQAELGMAVYESTLDTGITGMPRQPLPGQPDYLLRLELTRTVQPLHYGMQWRWQGSSRQSMYDASGNADTLDHEPWHELDWFAEKRWSFWQAGINLNVRPEPARQNRLSDRYWQTDAHWQLWLNLSGQF